MFNYDFIVSIIDKYIDEEGNTPLYKVQIGYTSDNDILYKIWVDENHTGKLDNTLELLGGYVYLKEFDMYSKSYKPLEFSEIIFEFSNDGKAKDGDIYNTLKLNAKVENDVTLETSTLNVEVDNVTDYTNALNTSYLTYINMGMLILLSCIFVYNWLKSLFSRG